jgi:prepilin-type N-terminal cleavage/methylation domain-containing protein
VSHRYSDRNPSKNSALTLRCGGCFAFSLIELMIVIVILGALVAMVIPLFSYSETDAKKDAVTSEMAAIRRAYLDFYSDTFPAANELQHLARYGLYPLVFTNRPDGYGGSWSDAVRGAYDPYNKLGWNGPYLMHEGSKTVRVDEEGQNSETGGTQVSTCVVFDPYGGYYRVLASATDPAKLSLICTGRNQELETVSTLTTNGWIVAQGDDTVLPLTVFK